jgi:bifunctional DNase/RNase
MGKKMYEAEIWTIARLAEGTALLLRPLRSNLAAPIFIGENEAQAIFQGLSGVVFSRPLTHDLFLEFIQKGGFTLCRVEVWDLRDNVFYARMILTGGEFSEENPLTLDARPSDALALAVRSHCPVFISTKVADEAALPLEFFLDTLGGFEEIPADIIVDSFTGLESELSGFIARRESLRIELDQAVASEEYERAAELRDVLALLDKEGGNER